MRSKYQQQWTLLYYHVPRHAAANRRFARRLRHLLAGPTGRTFQLARDGHGYSLLLGAPETWAAKIVPDMPPDAEIRVIGLTDAQYAKMRVLYGEKGT